MRQGRAQISRAQISEESRPPGWRTRAKERALSAATWASNKAETHTDRLRKNPHTGRAMAAYNRYYAIDMRDAGSAVVYYATLALLPVVVLGYLALAWLARHHPKHFRNVDQNLATTLGIPVNSVSSLFNDQAHALFNATTSIVGFVGVVYGAWAWMDTLGRALRTIWGTENHRVLWRRYRRDSVAALLGIPAMFAAFAVSGVTVTNFVRRFQRHGFSPQILVNLALSTLTLIVSSILFTLVCQQLYRRLGGAPSSRLLWVAAAASGLCLAGLSAGAQVILRQTVSNPYGIVINILGLMLWVSIAVRIVISLALWVAVDPVAYADEPR